MYSSKLDVHSKRSMYTKIITQLATASILSVLAMPVFANTVAVWNSQVAINNTNIAKTKIGVVQAAVKPKQQQLDSYKATIERLQKQYATQNAQMTQAQKDDLRKQIQTNLQNYEQVASQIQSIIDANEAEVMQRIVPKIQAIKENIVRQKNTDVLIDNRDRTVSYVKPEWDVTADFTKAINDQVK